jgi:CDP-diacylglycerol--glycerol-3-phosphate 3-phosphatidyltransferase
MLAKWLRPLVDAVFTPLAKLLYRLGVTPDMVTIFGALAAVAVAFALIPAGHLWAGALAIGLLTLLDTVDGNLARMSGKTGPWGAFLDSTLDRISDGAIFGAILLYFVRHPELPFQLWGVIAALSCLIFGAVVPYARARAGSLGVETDNGIFTRETRLVFALLPLLLVGFGLPVLVLIIALTIVGTGALVTIWQRILEVRRHLVTGN